MTPCRMSTQWSCLHRGRYLRRCPCQKERCRWCERIGPTGMASSVSSMFFVFDLLASGLMVGLALTGPKKWIFLFAQIELHWAKSMRTGLDWMMRSLLLSLPFAHPVALAPTTIMGVGPGRPHRIIRSMSKTLLMFSDNDAINQYRKNPSITVILRGKDRLWAKQRGTHD